MERREFMTLIGSAAATTAWSPRVRAQQPRLPTIGVVGPTTPAAARWTGAFEQRLREHGWIDGRTATIEYRWAQGDLERSAGIIAEFVRLKVDVIVTLSVKDAIAAKQATLTPIVFIAGDPVGFGLVASLARPGGNATGLSTQTIDLGAKRIELLREVTPGLSRMAVMFNLENPGTRRQMAEAQTAASALGVGIVPLEIRQTADIAPAIDAVAGRVQALRVMGDRITFDEHALINTLALAARLPTMHSFRLPVEAGGLMSYAPSFEDMIRQVADYIDKILRGSRPADLPVRQPTRFELVINLKTAKALGLDIPARLLVLADQLIE